MSVEFVQIDWSEPSEAFEPVAYLLMVLSFTLATLRFSTMRTRHPWYWRYSCGYACLGISQLVLAVRAMIIAPDLGMHGHLGLLLVATLTALGAFLVLSAHRVAKQSNVPGNAGAR